MKKGIKRFALLAVLLLCLSCLACGKDSKPGKQDLPKIMNCPVLHEPEFGGVYIKMTIDDFNLLGFRYGDSVDVSFSNGYQLEDLPYYNGYYVENGEPLLVAYPGYDYIKACINNGDDLWVVAGLDENCTAEVSLTKSGTYLDIQNARDIHYFDEREKYPSDEAFANFRCFRAGRIKEAVLFRGASPCDNQHKRAPYVDEQIRKAGVKCILDLADNEEKLQGYIAKEDFDSPYFLTVCEAGNVIPLALNMNFQSDDFRSKIISGFNAMAEKEGPYYVHCTEGKDRTGFVCLLIEALAGASYDEIVDDYMITYANYYKITEKDDPERYKTIRDHVLLPMMRSLSTDPEIDLKKADLSECARTFLKDGGMSDQEIDRFLSCITEP